MFVWWWMYSTYPSFCTTLVRHWTTIECPLVFAFGEIRNVVGLSIYVKLVWRSYMAIFKSVSPKQKRCTFNAPWTLRSPTIVSSHVGIIVPDMCTQYDLYKPFMNYPIPPYIHIPCHPFSRSIAISHIASLISLRQTAKPIYWLAGLVSEFFPWWEPWRSSLF